MGFFILSVSVCGAEDNTTTLDYVLNTKNGTYKLYGKNIPTDPNFVNIYMNEKKVDRSNIFSTKE
jgi:hypothetical protein